MAWRWIVAAVVGLTLTAGCAQGSSSRVGSDGGGNRDDGGGVDAAHDGGGGTDSGGDDDGGPILDRDSGSDDGGDTGCTSAADCDDELACNGTERCSGDTCEPGTPVTCDDGIPCTVDSCVDPDGTCDFTPDDTACGDGESCDPGSGCISGCSESPCKLAPPQCGCESGEGCYLASDGSRVCSTAGTAGEGEACGPPGCDAGFVCTNLDEAGDLAGCLRFCNGDPDCVGEGSLCIITFEDSSGAEIPDATACTVSCDPIAQTGCPSGTHCFPSREPDGAMRGLTHCAGPNGTGSTGACCADDTECQPGFGCIEPGTAPSQCMKWCERPTGAGCPVGTTCLGFTDPLIVGATEYGVCAPSDTSTCS